MLEGRRVHSPGDRRTAVQLRVPSRLGTLAKVVRGRYFTQLEHPPEYITIRSLPSLRSLRGQALGTMYKLCDLRVLEVFPFAAQLARGQTAETHLAISILLRGLFFRRKVRTRRRTRSSTLKENDKIQWFPPISRCTRAGVGLIRTLMSRLHHTAR